MNPETELEAGLDAAMALITAHVHHDADSMSILLGQFVREGITTANVLAGAITIASSCVQAMAQGNEEELERILYDLGKTVATHEITNIIVVSPEDPHDT